MPSSSFCSRSTCLPICFLSVVAVIIVVLLNKTGASRSAALLGLREGVKSIATLSTGKNETAVENDIVGENNSEVVEAPLFPAGEYRDPSILFGYHGMFPDQNELLPLPIQVMEEYKSYHSVESLTRNPDLENRRFVIGMFSCPHEGGHRLHIFANAFMMAVMTNRTLLWKDWDDEVCADHQRFGQISDKAHLCRLNTLELSRQTLVPAPWIPMYDEWSPKLNLSQVHALQVFKNETEAKEMHERPRWDSAPKVGGIDVKPNDHQIIAFPDNGLQTTLFALNTSREEILYSESARTRAIKANAWGNNFLYGMLHRYAYDLASQLRAFEEPLPSDDNSVSIALHSRHRFESNDGCNIHGELECLREWIGNKTQTDQKAILRVMSDRQCTIDNLRAEYHKPPESIVMVADHEAKKGLYTEQGPYAGPGYFEDMAFVSGMRSAFLGTIRASTLLPLEWVEFHRKLEIWAQSGKGEKDSEISPPDIPFCQVSNGHEHRVK